MKIMLSTIIVLLFATIYCKYETPPGYGDPNSEESNIDSSTDSGMDDIPDMNFLENVKVQKAEPNQNTYYMKSPGFMDNDTFIKRGFTSLKKKDSARFRFSQSPIDNEFLNTSTGSSDPMKPAKHHEEIRRKDMSNGVILSNRRRTVNFESGDFPEMYLDLSKD